MADENLLTVVRTVIAARPDAVAYRTLARNWTMREVGDGNLNLVFIVKGPTGGVCVKQALPYVRLVGKSWPLPIDRAHFEHEALKAEAAVVSAYASICRAQFSTGADFSARLAALAKVDRYSRGELVAKGGWATMSGAKEPQYGVAQECAELLVPEKT